MKKCLLLTFLSVFVRSVAYSQSFGGALYQYVPPLKLQYIPTTPAPQETSLDYGLIDYNAVLANSEKLGREAIAGCAKRNKDVYESFKSYPSSLADGWYKVAATDEVKMCGERIVYVQDNRVTKYFVDEIHAREVKLSSLVENGYATVKVGSLDATFVSCYFLDNIIDPLASTPAPQFGTVNFYTSNVKLKGMLNVDLDGEYVGGTDRYFASGVPNCGQQYAVLVFKKPGTYYYEASDDKLVWKGTVEVKDGVCTPIGLPGKR